MALRGAVCAVMLASWAGMVAASPPVGAATLSPGAELQQAIQAWQQAPYRQTQVSAEVSLSVTWQAGEAQSLAWSNLAKRLARDGQRVLFRADDDVWQVSGDRAEWFACSGATGVASVFWFRGAAYEKEQGQWVSAAASPALWNPLLGAWTSPHVTARSASEDDLVAVMAAASARSVWAPWIAGAVGSALYGSRPMPQADLQALLAHTTVYGHFGVSRAAGAPALQAATVAAIVAVPSQVVAHALGGKAANAVRSMTWRIDWTMKASYLQVSEPLPQGLQPAGWPSPGMGNSTETNSADGNAAQSNGEAAGGSLQNGA